MANQTETILRTLHEWIDTGRLNPGDEIEEGGLVQHFGVSRTPVREALMQIEATGLVSACRARGRSSSADAPRFLAILEVHASWRQAAGLAARRLSVSGRRRWRPRPPPARRIRHAGRGRARRLYQLNLRFHGTVAESAGNPFLLDMIKTNARKLMAYYRARYRYAGSIEASARDHRQIAALIVARDSEGAEAAMRHHVQFDQVTAMDLLAALG
jgi:transcriptional regulator, GntR family